MTGGALTFHAYYLGEISRTVRTYDALHTSFLNVQLPGVTLQCQQNILTQILKPPQ